MTYDQRTEELARRAATGDTAALDLLLARIRPQVLQRCARILPCFQDAEEACQDVLVQVARHVTSFEGRSAFSTWLYVVVANCARQTYRSLRRRHLEQADRDEPAEVVDRRTTSVIAGTRLDLLDALERLEAHRPELAAPFILRDLCHLDYREISEQLGINVGTAKSRIHHARRHIRASLQGGS